MSSVLPSRRDVAEKRIRGGFDVSPHSRLTERGVRLIHRKVESLEEVSGRDVRGEGRKEMLSAVGGRRPL